MWSSRRIAGFFARLAIIYGLFVIPWPGIKTGYAAFFRVSGTFFFESLIPGGSVRFEPAPNPTGRFDTVILCVNKRTGAEAEADASSRNSGYLQTALLISLVLATPLPWSRRVWALLWGLLLVNVAMACTTLVLLLRIFSSRGFLLELTPFWDKILEVAFGLAMTDAVTLWPVSVLTWIVVSFRRSDWATAFGGPVKTSL